ncbi:precorrin-2 C(20)-methyltransferase [Deferribacteraceae bacterium V6Fe1]|nr:precorrin-2 C(20)-methyltransferase [Deferribacteraceae bacterium V6Fe1]
MQKMIYALGIGPGDPELITLKALNVLKNSDIIVTPQSDKNGRSLAKDIISGYVPLSKIYMYYFPMNNNKDLLDEKYSELAITIEQFLKENKKVSYVTIGDLSIYSTFNYLEKKLQPIGIKVEKVPGIPSFIAAANRIDENIVVKEESFCVVEMPNSINKLDSLLENFSTIVIMKVHKKLNCLKEFVKNCKKIKKGFLIERASLPEERVFDLLSDEIPENAGYLSTAILYSEAKNE